MECIQQNVSPYTVWAGKGNTIEKHETKHTNVYKWLRLTSLPNSDRKEGSKKGTMISPKARQFGLETKRQRFGFGMRFGIGMRKHTCIEESNVSLLN